MGYVIKTSGSFKINGIENVSNEMISKINSFLINRHSCAVDEDILAEKYSTDCTLFGSFENQGLYIYDENVLEELYSNMIHGVNGYEQRLYCVDEDICKYINISDFYIDGDELKIISDKPEDIVKWLQIIVDIFKKLNCTISGHIKFSGDDVLDFGYVVIIDDNVRTVMLDISLDNDNSLSVYTNSAVALKHYEYNDNEYINKLRENIYEVQDRFIDVINEFIK